MVSNRTDTSNALTMTDLVLRLKRCLKVKRPAFVWGGPGLGKSCGINALAKELGGVVIDIRLSQMDPTDIKGIPYPAKDENGRNVMCWAPPEQLPTKEFCDGFPIVILFLDEMNSAPPSVQAAAYQLVLDRKVGTYTLPDNVCVLAAGNRETDRGVTFRMPAPLSNRFLHFEIKADFDSWLDWAIPAKIHPDIVSFLSTFRHKLYEFDPTSADKSFPTPRSYEFASQLITTEPDEEKLSDTEIREFMTSAVGAGTATDFMAYLKVGKGLPKPSDILNGKVTTINTREISAHYQLIVGMLYEMNEFWTNNSVTTGTSISVSNRKVADRKWNNDNDVKTWMKMLDNFNGFILTQVELEIGMMAARMEFSNFNFGVSLKGTKYQFVNLKSWPQFIEKFAKYALQTTR